ncbi:MAG: hypothetical protein BGO49_24460 [Planctomycetales bacterium 71-10]|nr:MAG: hypothetical protein BGO49_24460 [Planctomycetales bacterium 71-10]
MSIDISRYIRVTSGVGAGANLGVRQLNAMLITTNPLCPTGTFLSFASAANVGSYFGTTSDEYKRATFYFGWVSKNVTSPQALNFWFWNEDADVPSRIYGKPNPALLPAFTAISSGSFTLTLGGATHTLTGINCSAAGSLSAVAGIIQTAIRAYSSGGSAWTGATVAFDATRGSFNLTSGASGDDSVAVTAAVSNDLASPLGWLAGAIFSNGQGARTIPDMLTQLNNTNDNFGSFAFMDALSLDEVVSAAEWNDSLPSNVKFMYSVPCTASNASALSSALRGIGGSTLTLAPLAAEYPEMCPMMILAATNYNGRSAVQNFMFQEFDLTPSVTTDGDADLYDSLLVNYYGRTQSAGQNVSFYQRGLMFGLASDPSDQNTYCNEIWFKSACTARLMNLLLALSRVSANSTGRAQILASLQEVIDLALFNGVISVGKPLNSTQKLYITNATGDNAAWHQVQDVGYWVGCVIESYVASGVTQWKATYTIIYSKDDTIRRIDGTDILI